MAAARPNLDIAFGDPRLPKHFWEKVRVDERGCWVWTAYRGSTGYGRFSVNRKSRYAHRVAYEALVASVPEGLECDHLCRVRACVFPGHLEVVTHAENVRRGDGGKANREKTHCIRGHKLSGKNLFTDRNGGRCCATCKQERLAKRMKCPEYRAARRALVRGCQAQARLDPARHEAQRRRDRESLARRLRDPGYRAEMLRKERESKREKRLDPAYVAACNARKRERRRLKSQAVGATG